MLVKMHGAALQGVEAHPVSIEVFVGTGAQYYMVGLPDNSIRESWKRMETAIRSSSLRMPRSRIVINLAPADLPKRGAAFDLPMAIGILQASGQIPQKATADTMLWGELALDGGLRPSRGALNIAALASRQSLKRLIVPRANAKEAAQAGEIAVYGAENLKEVVGFLKGLSPLDRYERSGTSSKKVRRGPDLADVAGQEIPKRALELAAAGGHNLLMSGPPGAGKTMLARRLPSILPDLSIEEGLEVTQIHSVAGQLQAEDGLLSTPPFRAPHHTCSNVALVGGGNPPGPGEISLAHQGVLYLDEMPEFRRSVLEVLRQPIEEGMIVISRARYSMQLPARFMLLASMNPCPCGYLGHPQKSCSCHPIQIQRYRSKISGPLLDRFDMQINVKPVPIGQLRIGQASEKSRLVRDRVLAARSRQQERQGDRLNAHLQSSDLSRHCHLSKELHRYATGAADKLKLSARAYTRVLKVARTIADLLGEENISKSHLNESLSYRTMQ